MRMGMGALESPFTLSQYERFSQGLQAVAVYKIKRTRSL